MTPGEPASKWPKAFPPLSPEQERIRDDFMKRWLEVLPRKYGAIERFNHTYPLRSLKFCAQGKRIRTLEVGAGLGAHIGFENLAGQEYFALELREPLCRALREKFPAVSAHCGDIQKRTEFEAGFFDRILAIHVLEHLPDLPRALLEIDRILAPDGIFSIVIPCEGGFAYSLARKISAQRLFERTYRQPYDWCILREHVNRADEIEEELLRRFRIVQSRRWPLPGLPLALNLVVGFTLVKR